MLDLPETSTVNQTFFPQHVGLEGTNWSLRPSPQTTISGSDALLYWSIRQDSRLHTPCVAVILDGMDQAKFAYPRTPIMDGKQWANLARPRCHIVGIKVHGYAMFFAVSRADAAKDSNHHCELLCHTLTLVKKRFGLDFSKAHCHIQSDNCLREVKNNSIARWCSTNTSRGMGLSNMICYSICVQTAMMIVLKTPQASSYQKIMVPQNFNHHSPLRNL